MLGAGACVLGGAGACVLGAGATVVVTEGGGGAFCVVRVLVLAGADVGADVGTAVELGALDGAGA